VPREPAAQGQHEALIARVVGKRHAIEAKMNGLVAVVLDLDAAQRGTRADIQRRDTVAPICALAGEALDHGGAASLAELDHVAHMRRLRRSRASDVDDLNRTVEDHAGLEREHEAVGEEGGVK
jgi:hypothetical protein